MIWSTNLLKVRVNILFKLYICIELINWYSFDCSYDNIDMVYCFLIVISTNIKANMSRHYLPGPGKVQYIHSNKANPTGLGAGKLE